MQKMAFCLAITDNNIENFDGVGSTGGDEYSAMLTMGVKKSKDDADGYVENRNTKDEPFL